MVIYVTTQGARIVKEGKHLLVKKEGAIYHTPFTYKLDYMVVQSILLVIPDLIRNPGF